MTRNQIEVDLSKSPFICMYSGLEFHFSSQLHLTKFVENLNQFSKSINSSLTKRFKVQITFNVLSAVLFYNRIETRGFFIKDGGVIYTCLDQLQFAGGEMILKSSQTLLEDTIVLLPGRQSVTQE